MGQLNVVATVEIVVEIVVVVVVVVVVVLDLARHVCRRHRHERELFLVHQPCPQPRRLRVHVQ